MNKMMYRWARTALATTLLGGCAAQTHHRTGMAALDKHDYPAAVSELNAASTLAPENHEYRRDALVARETSTETLLNNAQQAVAKGDLVRAAQGYATVLRYDPQNARALAGQEKLRDIALADTEAKDARMALKQDDVVEAMELAGRALKRVPGHADALTVRRELDALQAKQAMTAPSLSQVYKKPINLEFRDTSIKLVFDALSRTTGINFIFDRDVKPDQRTTVFLKQTSLDDAIDVILSTGQLQKKVLNPSSVLIYPNTPGKQHEYQDLMVRAFYLSNVEAKQAATMLKTVLKLKDIYVDDKYNLLVLRESPEAIGLAEKLIRLQDLEEPEVMLEVEVLEINRTRLLNAGIEWSSQLTVSPLGSTTTSTTTSGATTATMKLSDLKALTSDSIGITVPTATINLQKTDGDANLLANPRIRVRDREKAKILIGDKVPVVTTTSTNTFVTENIQYLDVGLKLEVEPDIHLQDEVGLKLSLEVSSLVSSVKTNNGSQAYQIGTRNFNSALRLKDGETQVLAGLINDEDRSAANRIPLLGDLPLLGRLFGSQSDTRNKSEIVLAITPHLIRNIQRPMPAAESFWSGTEDSLRDRPLQLRTIDADGTSLAPGVAPALPASVRRAPVTPASGADAPKLNWEAPPAAKVGEPVQLYLSMDSPETLRAASLQVAYDPTEFELVALNDAGYFGKDNKGAFSKSVDAASGRASVGMKAPDDAPAKGQGRVLALTLKPLRPVQDASVSVISMTPIGAQKAIGTPALPAAQTITVTN